MPDPPEATKVTPPSVDRCHSIVPVEFARFTVTLVPPTHTGLAVAREAVPPTGAANTVRVETPVTDGLHTLLGVRTRTCIL